MAEDESKSAYGHQNGFCKRTNITDTPATAVAPDMIISSSATARSWPPLVHADDEIMLITDKCAGAHPRQIASSAVRRVTLIARTGAPAQRRSVSKTTRT